MVTYFPTLDLPLEELGSKGFAVVGIDGSLGFFDVFDYILVFVELFQLLVLSGEVVDVGLVPHWSLKYNYNP